MTASVNKVKRVWGSESQKQDDPIRISSRTKECKMSLIFNDNQQNLAITIKELQFFSCSSWILSHKAECDGMITADHGTSLSSHCDGQSPAHL